MDQDGAGRWRRLRHLPRVRRCGLSAEELLARQDDSNVVWLWSELGLAVPLEASSMIDYLNTYSLIN